MIEVWILTLVFGLGWNAGVLAHRADVPQTQTAVQPAQVAQE